MKTHNSDKLSRVAAYVLAAVLVLVPFHAFLTVFVSTFAGHYDALRIWKEVVLLALLPVAVWLICKLPGLRRQLRQGWLFWAILCYVLLHVALGLLALLKGQVNGYALLYALDSNLRPLLIFVLAFIFAGQVPWLHANWKRLLLWPAALVIGFGLLQLAVLPADFLKHFGYSAATIPPYGTVDQKDDYVRIQSTLRGANPLGAYLVLVLGAGLVLLNRQRTSHNGMLTALVVGGVVVLAASYSRSAYVGLVLVILAGVVFALRSGRARLKFGLTLAVLAVLTAAIFPLVRENDRFENTFFHTNEQSRSSISSNEQRLTSLQGGVHDVVSEPFGRGPGTAGPASLHNSQPGRIAENYYLQIGQETGWLGLGLFVAILAMVAKRLWQKRDDTLARALLVSLVGISFINLVQHAWADDTLALVWWGFAGIALSMQTAKTSN